jgi:poly(3-hydroxyoctanoate) depolymerase
MPVRAISLLLLVACQRAGVQVTDDLRTISDPSTPTADTATADTDTTVPTTPILEPVCTHSPDLLSCPFETTSLPTAGIPRTVHGQRPNGTPPAEGWPVVILFQGSFFSAELCWEARPTDPFGAWYQTSLVSDLLDAGFAVLTPEALVGGNTFWNTNVPPWSLAWNTAPDHDLMVALFAAIDDGSFGRLNGDRLFATAISSGGYMTSRMALSYPGRFEALAIQSGSWATCSGPICLLPNNLPADHPPTLFLHGENDLVVPISTMQAYADRLADDGVPVKVVRDPNAGHEWIAASPASTLDWFLRAP